MKKSMTPRQVREAIEAIDRRLGELEPWERRLSGARLRYVLDGDGAVVDLIDAGVRPGEGRPSDPELEPFDRRWPGLRATQSAIADLRERRTLLEGQHRFRTPDASRDDAATRANEVIDLSKELENQTEALKSALAAVAHLALSVAQQRRSVWERNLAIDKLCNDADIERPHTPRRDAVALPAALPLSTLLSGYFVGGVADAVDSSLIRDLRAALGEAGI